jgi:hypothetical protein
MGHSGVKGPANGLRTRRRIAGTEKSTSLVDKPTGPPCYRTLRATSMAEGPTLSIHSELVTRAKSRVARWFDQADEPASLRPKILSGLDRIANELPHRANWFEVMTVGLDHSASLSVHVKTQQFRSFSCRDCLAVSTIVPGWNFGWSNVIKNEEVHQVLSWFLHYARQYVHRSYVACLLMIVWEETGKVLHPFGSQAIYQRFGPVRPMVSAEQALDAARLSAHETWGLSELSPDVAVGQNSPWVHRNTLDPYLHQAVFHFLRAQNLRSRDFAIEAVVAFDCMMQSIAAFLRARCNLVSELTRGQICGHLQLPAESAELAEYIYFIRNNFGAHPGGWRWWDLSEIFDDISLDDIAAMATTTLHAAADLEPQVRSVEPFPPRWGHWLFENFDMLWDAVWFEKSFKF